MFTNGKSILSENTNQNADLLLIEIQSTAVNIHLVSQSWQSFPT